MLTQLRIAGCAFCLLIIAFNSNAQNGIFLSPGTSLSVLPGTVFSVDSLVLIPSANFTINGANSETRNAVLVHPMNSANISRVFHFASTLDRYSGNISIYYQDAELGSIPEENLALNIYDGSNWKTYTDNVTRDATQNFVSAAGLNNISLNELTLAYDCPLKTTYYKDNDGDGYGDVASSIQDCNQPDGYVTNNTDCNDNDAAIHASVQYYVDADHDGYGSTTTEMVCASTPPVGYSTNNTDCNDNDAAIHASVQYYVDADHDGYGSTTTEMVCASTPPVGYSTNNTDCNDNDVAIHAPVQYYVDADHDGYGSTTTEMVCASTPPVGYSINNTDCNDNNASVYPKAWYHDADGDGYGTALISIQACSKPAGYVANKTDCEDGDATVHPGAPEKCDGIDNNCNGQTDEGFVKTTWYKDGDGDGYGDPLISVKSCSVPAGYVTNKRDCDDGKATVHPGAPDICDGLDNDCDGVIDENCPAIIIVDKSIAEGNTGQKTMNFVVKLNVKSTQTVTVDYTTHNGTATAGSDYVAKQGTLSFAPGVTSTNVSIIINCDKNKEPNETFTITLNNPVKATIADGTATGTITNDDGLALAATATQIDEPAMKVSPNPASSVIKVQLTGYTGNITLQLRSIEGKPILDQKVRVSGKITLQQLNVSHLAAGTYFLVLLNSNGHSQTQSVIIAR